MSMSNRRRLPPLNAIRAFEAASRHSSFQAAADELAVTPGAVAQQVKSLEQWLGLSLFRRLPSKGIALTQAGQRYAASASEHLDGLADATTRLMAQDNANVLTVSTIPSFAAQWLIPRLGSFRAAHPNLDVRVMASNSLTDFGREDVDVAIRYGRGDYPASVVRTPPRGILLPDLQPAARRHRASPLAYAAGPAPPHAASRGKGRFDP